MVCIGRTETGEEINQEKSESLRVNEGVQMTSVYEAGNDAVGITLVNQRAHSTRGVGR